MDQAIVQSLNRPLKSTERIHAISSVTGIEDRELIERLLVLGIRNALTDEVVGLCYAVAYASCNYLHDDRASPEEIAVIDRVTHVLNRVRSKGPAV